ncbi:MAG: hypothetical protein NTY09_09695 [bacterium]|nr:hypothetical protein [bacterium]
MTDLPILITVDVCDGAFDSASRPSRFAQLIESLPPIFDLLKETICSHTSNESCPVTWFVRADTQVKVSLGSTTALLDTLPDFWLAIEKSDGEIGWHPHFYFMSDGIWLPIRDKKKIELEARQIWDEITSSGWKPKVCRMGESVGSNDLMQFLDSIGMLADLSALPGRKRDDIARSFNWVTTPQSPYHPDISDYRKPGDNPFSILEIPFTMAPVRAPYDSPDLRDSEIRRYIDLSYDPSRLKYGLENIQDKVNYLVAVIHPLQATGISVPDGGLVIGGLENVRENLKNILELFSERTIVFKTASEFAGDWISKI